MRLSVCDQCVWWSYGDCYVEYMWVNTWWMHSVHARNCRNTRLWHECSTSECTKWDAAMAGGDELTENSNPLIGLEFDGTTCWSEDLCTLSRTENRC